MYTGDGSCVCSINKEAAETKCICLYHTETGERDIYVIDCGVSIPKRRGKRAILPVANLLPASESEEGDKPKPKHGQDATAAMNGNDPLLRARRATLKRLYSADNSADTQPSNYTDCYKPNWCDCLCKKVGAKDKEAKAHDCICGDMPEWNCEETNAQQFSANTRMSSCVYRLSSH